MDITHLHLLLNHFPTVGFIIGLGLFIVAIVGKSDDLKQAALAVFIGIAFLTIPTYVTGNGAQEVVEGLPGIADAIIATHEGAAFLAMVVIELTGALAWLALWKFRRTARFSSVSTAVILVFSLVAFALVARSAYIGGQIGHAEIRAAVAPTTAEGPLARAVGEYVRDTPWAWVAAEALHFVGLSLIIGVLLLVDLRMLGLMKQVSFAALDRLLPWAMLGFTVNVITGMLFFAASPGQYTNNPAFFWKLVFLLIAGANALYFTYDKAWRLEPGRDVPGLSKLLAASALALWVGVMYWGSMLPFIGNAF